MRIEIERTAQRPHAAELNGAIEQLENVERLTIELDGPSPFFPVAAHHRECSDAVELVKQFLGATNQRFDADLRGDYAIAGFDEPDD